MNFVLAVSSYPSREKYEILLTAHSEGEAVAQAQSRGLTVLQIRAVVEEGGRAAASKKFPTLRFAQELLTLLDAGVNVHEACVTLHRKESDASHKTLLAEIVAELELGRPLSDTLARWPATFPNVMIATARATERSGGLAPPTATIHL